MTTHFAHSRFERRFLSALQRYMGSYQSNDGLLNNAALSMHLSNRQKMQALRHVTHELRTEIQKQHIQRLNFDADERMKFAKIMAFREVRSMDEKDAETSSNTDLPPRASENSLTIPDAWYFLPRLNQIIAQAHSESRISEEKRNAILHMWRSREAFPRENATVGRATEEHSSPPHDAPPLKFPTGALLAGMMKKTNLSKAQINYIIRYHQKRGQVTQEVTNVVREWLQSNNFQLPSNAQEIDTLMQRTNLTYHQLYHLLQRLLPRNQKKVSEEAKSAVLEYMEEKRRKTSTAQPVNLTFEEKYQLSQNTGLSRKQIEQLVSYYTLDPRGKVTTEKKAQIQEWIENQVQRSNTPLDTFALRTWQENITREQWQQLQDLTALSRGQVKQLVRGIVKRIGKTKESDQAHE